MTVLKEMRLTLLLVWPLLFGVLIMMVGSGLQGTLLSLRADIAGFPISVIGFIMSSYYCGYLAGSFLIPNMIRSVGHIRVFAGFASLASTTILLQGLFVTPILWGMVRFIGGLSFAGLFIVAESWLNDIAPNRLRGMIISSYVFVLYAGLFIGQFLINLAPVEDIHLFILVSIIISLSLIPITLADKASPGFEEAEKLGFIKLVKTSPLSTTAVAVSGFVNAAMLTLGPIYAENIGFSISKIASFMGVYILGGATIPLMAGWLSDQVDRRQMIIIMGSAAFLSCLLGAYFSEHIMPLIFLTGGFVLSVYSIGAALMNDRLDSKQRTSATASLIFIQGISSCFAPIVVGILMQSISNDIFLPIFAFSFLLMVAYGIHRSFIGPDVNVEDQADFQAMPVRMTPEFAQLAEEDAIESS